MKKLQTRIFAMLLAVMMIFSCVPFEATAEGTKTVTVSVEKFVLGQGYIVEPMSLTVAESTSAAEVFEQACTQAGHPADVQDGYYGKYINGVQDKNRGEIQVPQAIQDAMTTMGLIFNPIDETPDSLDSGDYQKSDYAAGIYAYSGWMFSINDVFSSTGIGACSLQDGDVLRVQFSMTGGTDIDSTASAWATPIYPNLAKKADLTKAVAKANGEIEKNPEYLNQNQTKAAYDKAMELLVSFEATQEQVNAAYEALTGEIAKNEEQQNKPQIGTGVKTTQDAIEKSKQDTVSYMQQTAPKYGAEWKMLGMARAGADIPSDYLNAYLASVQEKVAEKQGVFSSTDAARLILAMTALNQDVTNVAGYNLLQSVADYESVCKPGIYGPIFVLLAVDSNHYAIPQNATGTTASSRENMIRFILNQQLPGGGWGWNGVVDTDTTAMALQALTPYYSNNGEVQNAVNLALTQLSAIQNYDGTYSSFGTPNAESTAQVIVALTGLGISPDTDSRFIKDGYTTVDGLMKYAQNGGGFVHELGKAVDNYATDQAYYALVSYQRFAAGKNSLYNMTDAKSNTASGNTQGGTAVQNPETALQSTATASKPAASQTKPKKKSAAQNEAQTEVLAETLPETEVLEQKEKKSDKAKKADSKESVDNSESNSDNWKKVIPIVAILCGGGGAGILIATGKKKKSSNG